MCLALSGKRGTKVEKSEKSPFPEELRGRLLKCGLTLNGVK